MSDVASTAENEVLARICTSVVALRFVVLTWAFTVATIDARSGVLTHPAAAFAVLAVLVAANLWWSHLAHTNLARLTAVGPWVDAVLAIALVVADHAAYAGAHPQSLGSAWPATAAITVGVLRGGRAGGVAGAVIGAANLAATAAFGQLDGNVLATVGSAVLLAAAGWVAGTVAARLRTDAATIARAEAREELARDLHDGVLQTLAVIQRRSSDTELVDMARTQSVKLRHLLTAGPDTVTSAAISDRVRAAAVEWTARHGIDVTVTLLDDPDTSPAAADALIAAAGEAVTNAAKHSGIGAVTVSVDRGVEGGTVIVVHDEGHGFDPATTTERIGMSRSIRGRIADVGGTVDVRSAAGAGCEVTLWTP